MSKFKKYLKRPNENNLSGRQVVGKTYGRGGADIISSVAGFTTTTSSSGTDFIYQWTSPNATAVGVVTFRVGTASTWGHSIMGSYYPKYYSESRAPDGISGSIGRDYSSFRLLLVGGGNNGANGGTQPYEGPGAGGRGGSVVDTTFNGVSTAYTIKFGIAPEPSSRVYFQNTVIGINTFAQAGAGGPGGGSAGIPGTGGVLSDITGSSLGYGGGGGGGGESVPCSGGAGVNGGGPGGSRTANGCPPPQAGTPGTRGGGGGGGAYGGAAGGTGGPFVVLLRSSPNSTTGVFDI